jgi:hypothetical protein
MLKQLGDKIAQSVVRERMGWFWGEIFADRIRSFLRAPCGHNYERLSEALEIYDDQKKELEKRQEVGNRQAA